MIRKPLTTITINNDPTANALKPSKKNLLNTTSYGSQKRYISVGDSEGFPISSKTGKSIGRHQKKALKQRTKKPYNA